MTKSDLQLPELNEQEAAQLLESAIAAAKSKLETLVDGNGLHKSTVRVSEKNLKLDIATLQVKCRLIPAEKETALTGIQEKGIVLSSRADLKDAIAEHTEKLEQDPELRQLIGKKLKEMKYGIDGEQTAAFSAGLVDFSFVEDCKDCQGQGKSTCPTCNGKRQSPCGKCQGKGKIMCFNCKGLKKIQAPDGSREACTECNGFGMTECPNCNGAKYIACRNCQQSGTVACARCRETGKNTILMSVTYKLQVTGKLDMAPDIQGLYAKARERHTDSGLIDQGHIKFDETHQTVAVENGYIYWTYAAYVPHGVVGFSLNGKRVDAEIFGYKGALFTDTLFIDSLVKPGISALNKIARGPMATRALFQQARAFRLIREITDKVTTQSKRKILRDIRQEYPIGLSDKYAKAAVKFADDAMRKIMVKPRWNGCIAGIILFGLFIGAWFHLGLRPESLQSGSLNIQLFADVTIWGLCGIATTYLIKFMAKSTIQKILAQPPEKMPAAGDQGLIAFAGLLLVFLIAGATSPTDPLWWSQFF